MSFFLENWHLFLVAATSGGLLLWPVISGGGAAAIPTSEAVRLLNREKGVLIDVCEPAEFAAGHAAGAKNVPMSGLAAALKGSKDLPANKALPVVVTCASGMRSARAAAQLRRAGWERAVSLQGGLNAWRDANLPVEKKA